MTSVVLDKPATLTPVSRSVPDSGPGFAVVAGILRVPLLGKVIGANLLLVLLAVVAHTVLPASSTMLLGAALGASFVISATLVWLALRPVSQLEVIADRVSGGDFAARVPRSELADRNIAKLSNTMNRLLDRVESDRARIHYLAGRSVRARDIEREAVARELRDSLAQMLTGVALEISAARRKCQNTDARDHLDRTGTLVQELGDEMRSVAETLYPGTLTEFGLVNGMEALARRVARRSGLAVEVEASTRTLAIDTAAAAALYRVADEALRNVEQHANARHARIRLGVNRSVCLEIEDDGRGLDLRSRDPLQAGLGLFSAKAVLALAGGELQIFSAPGLGTRVVARVPEGAAKGRS